MSYLRDLAQKIDTGSWTEKTGHDIVGLPRQICGNDCGIFMLMDVLNGKTSKWYPPKSLRQVPVYLDSEEQQDNLFAFLKSVLHKTPTKLSFTDEVQLICGGLFPEAIIYGLAGLQNLSLKDAEQAFLSGPHYHHSEVEEFNRTIEKRLRKEGRASSWSQ